MLAVVASAELEEAARVEMRRSRSLVAAAAVGALALAAPALVAAKPPSVRPRRASAARAEPPCSRNSLRDSVGTTCGVFRRLPPRVQGRDR